MTDKSGDRYGGANNNISTELLNHMVTVSIIALAFSVGMRQAMAVIQKAGRKVPDSLLVAIKAMEENLAPAIPVVDDKDEVTFEDATRYLFALSENLPLMREADLTLQGLGIHLYGLDRPLIEDFEEALRR